MSQDNVDVVRRAVDSFNRGDEGPSLDTVDEALVFEPLRTSVEGGYGDEDAAIAAAGLWA
jgi:hypothetical protein